MGRRSAAVAGDQSPDQHLLRRSARLLAHHGRRTVVVFGLTAVTTAFQVLTPAVFGRAIDAVQDQDEGATGNDPGPVI
ncbi:MAG: hypothetical protein AAGF73_10615 [Actinomycetota bacterium]